MGRSSPDSGLSVTTSRRAACRVRAWRRRVAALTRLVLLSLLGFLIASAGVLDAPPAASPPAPSGERAMSFSTDAGAGHRSPASEIQENRGGELRADSGRGQGDLTWAVAARTQVVSRRPAGRARLAASHVAPIAHFRIVAPQQGPPGSRLEA